jgi:uncharacterized protein YecT (DUF1311 family)
MHVGMRSLVLGLALLLAAFMPARAQPPDERLWRITGMIPEPWMDTRSIPASARDLVRAGLVFLDDAVKGPDPLACQHAVYRDSPVPLDKLFDGRVPENELEATVKRLGIDEVEPFAFQVVCGSDVTSYFAFGVDRLVRVGDAIYRLHPHDADPDIRFDEWVQRITPSFDCDRAQSTVEKLICTDERTAKADRIIAERYAALRTTLTPESFATIRATQRAWLRYVPGSCGADGALPEEDTARRDLLDCLREAYEPWAETFAGAHVEQTGELKIEPRMHIIAKLRPRHRLDRIVYPWMVGIPQATAAAFNAFIAKALTPEATLLTAQQITDPNDDGAIWAWREYGISNFDNRLVSLFISGQIYGGGAHEGLIEQALNWDVRRSRAVGPQDFFRPGSQWENAIAEYCREQLRAEEPGMEAALDAVRRVVVSDDAWQFDAQQASVHFAVYTIAGFASAPRDVAIGYAVLRPYLRPGAPLPAAVSR